MLPEHVINPDKFIPNDQPKEDFEALLDEGFSHETKLRGTVLRGTIIGFDKDNAVIDVGLKSEGRIPLREFNPSGQGEEVKIGDEVDVFVEQLENRDGQVELSREKARREEVWIELEKAYEKSEPVDGIIFNNVKGGYTVDLKGATAFLPGSQVDIRPIRDASALMGKSQPFMILKMDRARGNIVVSRRAVLEEDRAEKRSEILDKIEEGMVVEGLVKNITDYGAFIDLGGVDGLLHVTDMSWKRINHPSDILTVGETIEVQIIRFNEDNNRISLGIKQMERDPWEDVASKYPVGSKFKGRITNIADYGAFVEIEPGIEGLIHVSEMSWTNANTDPAKIVSTSEEVEVMILDVDTERRRISLGYKQCHDNPWTTFAKEHKAGDIIKGTAKNKTDFGLFIGLDGDIDGMVHVTDISWDRPGEEVLAEIETGTEVEAKILDIEPEKERISLGIKQLNSDPFTEALDGINTGDVVTCTVKEIFDKGIEVSVRDDLHGYIRRSDLSRDRAEQRPERFAVGEKVDAKIISIDTKDRKLNLSVKARELEEDKKAVAEYGSSDSGASLGDILGAALKENETTKEEKPKKEEDAKEEKPKAKAKAKPKKKATTAKKSKSSKKDDDDKAEKAKAKKDDK